MSWRQPESIRSATSASKTTRICAGTLIRHLRNMQWVKAFKKTPGLILTEPWVLGFNAEKKAIAAGANKPGRIEHRVIRLRQSIQGQHAEHGRQRCSQNSAFESHRNERRPGMKGLAAHIDGIVDRGN